MSDVVHAFMESPQYKHGILFIDYDEWGGFFEHVRPRHVPDERATPGNNATDYGLTGFRIPGICVSPYSRKGGVSHMNVTHESILKLISYRWKLGHLNKRHLHATNIGRSLDFENPDTSLPALPDPATVAKTPCSPQAAPGAKLLARPKPHDMAKLQTSGLLERYGYPVYTPSFDQVFRAPDSSPGACASRFRRHESAISKRRPRDALRDRVRGGPGARRRRGGRRREPGPDLDHQGDAGLLGAPDRGRPAPRGRRRHGGGGRLRDPSKAYHDSGRYRKDLQTVDNSARSYLKKQVGQIRGKAARSLATAHRPRRRRAEGVPSAEACDRPRHRRDLALQLQVHRRARTSRTRPARSPWRSSTPTIRRSRPPEALPVRPATETSPCSSSPGARATSRWSARRRSPTSTAPAISGGQR